MILFGLAKYLFFSEDKEEFKPLIEMLPYIGRAQVGSAISHLQKVIPSSEQPEALEEPKEMINFERYPELDLPFDLSKLESARIVDEDLMGRASPDVDIIILPPRQDIKEEVFSMSS